MSNHQKADETDSYDSVLQL